MPLWRFRIHQRRTSVRHILRRMRPFVLPSKILQSTNSLKMGQSIPPCWGCWIKWTVKFVNILDETFTILFQKPSIKRNTVTVLAIDFEWSTACSTNSTISKIVLFDLSLTIWPCTDLSNYNHLIFMKGCDFRFIYKKVIFLWGRLVRMEFAKSSGE